MKRLSLHIAFSLAYLLQDILLEFLWMQPALQNVSENKQLWMAFESAAAILIPKLLFSYFVIYIAFPRILKERNRLLLSSIEIFLALVVSIIIYRVLCNYYVYPGIYGGAIKTRPVFNLRGLLMALSDIGFVSGAAIALKLLRSQLTGKEREKRLVKEKLETELKFLRNQTNPHFLFNTLNNIYGLARKKSDNTAEIVLKLSKLLRFMIYESKKEFISIAEEVKILDDYLDLERIRYNNRLTVTFQKDIDDRSQQITPLLLLPLIENAFKHGASESLSDAYIDIRMSLKESHLIFEISNTIENEKTGDMTYNIGLGNLRRQLELVYKEHTLKVENNDAVFKVYLFINLKSHGHL